MIKLATINENFISNHTRNFIKFAPNRKSYVCLTIYELLPAYIFVLADHTMDQIFGVIMGSLILYFNYTAWDLVKHFKLNM